MSRPDPNKPTVDHIVFVISGFILLAGAAFVVFATGANRLMGLVILIPVGGIFLLVGSLLRLFLPEPVGPPGGFGLLKDSHGDQGDNEHDCRPSKAHPTRAYVAGCNCCRAEPEAGDDESDDAPTLATRRLRQVFRELDER